MPPPPPPPPGGGYQPYAPGVGATGGAQPDVGQAFSYGWRKLTENFGQILVAIGIWLVAVIVLGAIGYFVRDALIGQECRDTVFGEVCVDDTSFTGAWLANAVFQLLLTLAFVVGSYFIIRAALAITAGRTLTSGEIFDMTNFVPYLLTSIVVSILTSIGYVLCIVPGIIVMFLLFFAQYFAADRGMGVGESLSASFNIMKENIGTMVLFFLACLAAYIVGAIVLCVGLIVAVPVVLIATAYMYRTMSGEPVAP